MQHVILSRVNIPRELDPSKYDNPAPYKNPEWNESRIKLLNEFTRPSLAKQSCQDFTFITLWNAEFKGDMQVQNMLANEQMLAIHRGLDGYLYDERPFDFERWQQGTNDKDEMDFAYQIRDIVRKYSDELFGKDYTGPYLFTNLDSDDCLHYKAVELLQKRAKEVAEKAPYYLDVENRFVYNITGGGMGHKNRRTPSPMVSTVEKEIEVYPLRWHHSMMGQHLDGEIVPGVHGLQTVNEANIYSRGTGQSTNFNLKLYY